MKKQTEKRVTAGSSIVLPANSGVRSTKAQRIRQRATREEISENHGASKRVKITVETCVESLEQHIADNRPSQDSQNNIMISEEGTIVPAAKSATDADFVLVDDCDDVISYGQPEETEVKALPQRSQVVSASNPSDEKELLKKEMSLKAKDLLKINDTVAPANALVPAVGHALSFSHERSTYANDNVTKVYDHRSSEYVVNPLYTPNLDFSISVSDAEEICKACLRRLKWDFICGDRLSKGVYEKFAHLFRWAVAALQVVDENKQKEISLISIWASAASDICNVEMEDFNTYFEKVGSNLRFSASV